MLVIRSPATSSIRRAHGCVPFVDADAEHRLLHRILGIDDGAEHAVAVAGESGAILLEEVSGGHGGKA